MKKISYSITSFKFLSSRLDSQINEHEFIHPVNGGVPT